MEVQTLQPSPASSERCSSAFQTARPTTASTQVQTLGPPPASGERCSSASQTLRPTTASTFTQATPRRSTDRSTQAEDREARRREAVLKTQLADLEAHASDTAVRKLELEDELQREREGLEVWRSMAQKQTMGHIHVTILCPRAECTVNGVRVEVDSWNPAKIRQEFERDVMPRFARLFVDESGPGTVDKARLRPEAVERTMREFGDVFREKLSAMLTAPSPAAAAATNGAQARVESKAAVAASGLPRAGSTGPQPRIGSKIGR